MWVLGLGVNGTGGGQFKGAIQQIMEAESQPLKALEKRKGMEDTRLKLFQEFKSKFSSLNKALLEMNGFQKFRELKADLGDGQTIATVTLDKEKALPGHYDIEINELALRSSAMTNGFEDPDALVFGAGFVSLQIDQDEEVQVAIEESSASLRGIASQINQNSQSPVQAAVIEDASEPDAPWKLVFSGRKQGSKAQIEAPDFNFQHPDVEIYIDDTQEARNGSVVMNGFAIEVPSNDLPDFLPGINLHLKQAKPGAPFTLTISEDIQKVSGKVKALVDNLNQVLQFIIKQNTVDRSTDTTSTFAGDSTLQTLEFRLRNLLHQEVRVGGTESAEGGKAKSFFVHQIGIEFDKTGALSFKEDKFNKFVDQNFETVAEALSGPKGLVDLLRNTLEAYTRPGNGILTNKERGIHTRMDAIDQQIDQKTGYLDRKREALVNQFAKLEATLGNLQKQQQYLSAALPGAGGGMVSQLMG